MKKMLHMIVKTAWLCGLLACVSTVQANVITGKFWHVPEAVAQNAIPANVPGTTPDVVFDLNSPINLTNAGGSTVQDFLSSGGAFNIQENTAGTLASQLDDLVVGSLFEFTGFVTVTNGQVFSVTHDDGLTLIIGGLDLGFGPGPTGPVASNATYTGPTGTFAFQLVYTECCGGPAVLAVDLPFGNTPSVPEPFTLGLLGIGLAGLGYGRSRGANRA